MSGRVRWLGPLGLGVRDAARFHAALEHTATALGAPWQWVAVGIVIGTVPFAASWAVGASLWVLPTSTGLAALMVLGAGSRRPGAAMSAVGAGLFAHCALAIALTAHDPASTAGLLQDGPEYWEKTLRWVQTGESPEYQLAWWVPAHVQLVVITVVMSYLSLGITTLYEGMYEIGLMNHYVGNLVRVAHDPVTALFVGWHPWSVARGLGFLLLTYDLVDLSLSRMVGTALSTPRERAVRWALGLGFVSLDALLKLFLLEPIRRMIAGAL
ncbi:MAG: hypothetical protein R3F61_15370 [Myxococcota bacterium]